LITAVASYAQFTVVRGNVFKFWLPQQWPAIRRCLLFALGFSLK